MAGAPGKPTAMMREYVKLVELGVERTKAAKAVGYKDDTARHHKKDIDGHPWVAKQLAKIAKREEANLQSVQRQINERLPELVEVLIGIATDEEAPHAARIKAAQELLDRAVGKPQQSVDLNASGKLEINIVKFAD